MFTKKNILVLSLFIFIIAFNLAACTETEDNSNEITEISESGINNSEKNSDETSYINRWSEMDFSIRTDYPHGYDGAPIVMGSDYCGRDSTGKMSISEMIDYIDDIGGGFVFREQLYTEGTEGEGLHLRFDFNTNITPAEIKEVSYIMERNETERHYVDIYLDKFIKVPEKIGVYNFFVNLQWTDKSEEIVYFRVEIVESLEQMLSGEKIVTPDRFKEGKEIFLNPAVDVNTRIETFINTLFSDPKIIFFDNFDNMSEELQNFIFFVGVYRGIVYQRSGVIGEGLTKEMIEENIRVVFGLDVISKLDYRYIPADYDSEREIYIPWLYGAPGYMVIA